MKLTLFLDIDGVLNHEPCTVDCKSAQKLMGHRGWVLLCRKCIDRLNNLIVLARAKYDEVDIVCSSTWRHYFEPKELSIILAAFGLEFRLAGRTTNVDMDRGKQIIEYMKDNPTDSYIVLDDDTHDMELVKDYQIVTYYRSGFDNDSLERAINLIARV